MSDEREGGRLSAASPGSAPKTHVLIVEDEPQLLMLMQLELDGAGFSTSLAADGNEALEAMRFSVPDLVLLDLMMPFLDGWGVLEEMRGWTSRPSVIVTSAIGLHAQRQRALGMGAAGYLVKPFPIEELLDLIRDVLGLSTSPSELPVLAEPEAWGDAGSGYFVRVADGPQAGVWRVCCRPGQWDFSANRFAAEPRWVVRSPDGAEVEMTGAPQAGVRALEEWLAGVISPAAAGALVAYCAPSQDRLGQIVPRRHLAV
jgi:CheY-like chemotaxis protein